jgi:hypothetical protein
VVAAEARSRILLRKNIGIRLTNDAGFDTVLTGLITNGVNHIQGIDFRTTQTQRQGQDNGHPSREREGRGDGLGP